MGGEGGEGVWVVTCVRCEWERGGGENVSVAWSRRCWAVRSARKSAPPEVGGSQNTATPIQLFEVR